MTRPALFVILSALAAAPLAPVAAQNLLWMRQTGTVASDQGNGVALDSAGSVYVTGSTKGNLGGPNAGGNDAFLSKYDRSGVPVWTRQIGTVADDYANAVAVDSAGSVYITGFTGGSLGGPNAGGNDCFLAKYDATGNLVWTRQIGTSAEDYGFGVAVDSAGNAYITGYTTGSLFGTNARLTDVFLAKYNAAGTIVWTRQIGTSGDDGANAVAADSTGNVYITGNTSGNLAGTKIGSSDAFLIKYDASGTQVWARQFGTTDFEDAYGVAVDGTGNAYITGYTSGSLGGPKAGVFDVFLAKYSASGTPLWIRQDGTSSLDIGRGVAADSAGNAYITGFTDGVFAGTTVRFRDAIVAKYDAAGVQLWKLQIVGRNTDLGLGVVTDSAGNAYVVGSTEGDLGGTNAGSSDIFLAKYGEPTCPADFNHDGFVTGQDLDAYVAAFEAGSISADFNSDGFATGEDFDAYVTAFEAGC